MSMNTARDIAAMTATLVLHAPMPTNLGDMLAAKARAK